MTTGIVSALGRGFPVGGFGSNRYTLPDVIQTDAAINPGNSGGPLLNLNGEVVGVNFAIESQARQNSGVGFAIPVSIVQRVVPALIDDGAYKYAYLGLEGNTISPQLAEALELPDNTLGVYVSGVVPGGPSAEAGRAGRQRSRDRRRRRGSAPRRRHRQSHRRHEGRALRGPGLLPGDEGRAGHNGHADGGT